MKQLNLFNKSKLPMRSHHHKRKYSMKHWSHRQRLIHRVSRSKLLTWKKMDLLAKDYPLIIKLLEKYRNDVLGRNEIKPMKHPHTFPRTVNQKQLSKAVHAMYLRKHKQYPLSINKICKKFKISKPSLYRGYKSKYKK